MFGVVQTDCKHVTAGGARKGLLSMNDTVLRFTLKNKLKADIEVEASDLVAIQVDSAENARITLTRLVATSPLIGVLWKKKKSEGVVVVETLGGETYVFSLEGVKSKVVNKVRMMALRLEARSAGSHPTSPISVPAPLGNEIQPAGGTDGGEKTCPFCAETIKEAALKCKHCGEFLTAGSAGLSSEVAGSRGIDDADVEPPLNDTFTDVVLVASGHHPEDVFVELAEHLSAVTAQRVQVADGSLVIEGLSLLQAEELKDALESHGAAVETR